ncbi:hypothetical protein [Thiobacillus sp.]
MKHVTLLTTQATLSFAACGQFDMMSAKGGTPSMTGADVRAAGDYLAGQVR